MTTPYSAPKDTLQYQLGARPMTQRLDFSSSLMTDVMESFNAHPLPVDQEVYGLPKPAAKFQRDFAETHWTDVSKK